MTWKPAARQHDCDRRDATDQPVVDEGAAVKPPTDMRTIRPNSCGEKPSRSCRMNGVPASMPKLIAKAKSHRQHVAEEMVVAQHLARAAQQALKSRRAAMAVGLAPRPARHDDQQEHAEAADDLKVARQPSVSPRNPPSVGRAMARCSWRARSSHHHRHPRKL